MHFLEEHYDNRHDVYSCSDYWGNSIRVADPKPPPPQDVKTESTCSCVDHGFRKIKTHFYMCKTCKETLKMSIMCEYCANNCHEGHELVDAGVIPGYCYCYINGEHCACKDQSANPLSIARPICFITKVDDKELALSLDPSHDQNRGGFDLIAVEYDPDNPYQKWIYNFSGHSEIRNFMYQNQVLDRWDDKVYTHLHHGKNNQQWDFEDGKLTVRENKSVVTYGEKSHKKLSYSMQEINPNLNQNLEIRFPPLDDDFEPLTEIIKGNQWKGNKEYPFRGITMKENNYIIEKIFE